MYHGRYLLGSGLCAGTGLFGGLWTWLFGAGLLILAAAVIYLLVSKKRRPVASSAAINELDRKFAIGEINEEEYLRRKNILKEK